MGISQNLRVTPEQLAESWEAHSLNKNVDVLTDLTFDAYRNALRKEFDSAPPSSSTGGVKVEPGTSGAVVSRAGLGKRNNNNVSALVTPPPSKRHNLGGGAGASGAATSAVDAVGTTTPADSPNNKKTGSGSTAITPAPSTAAKPLRTAKYGERTNVGQTVATYNPANLPDYTSSGADGVEDLTPRCTIDGQPAGSQNVTKPYRYMFTPLEDRARALDDHLVGLGEEIMERFDIKAGEEAGSSAAAKREQDAAAEDGAADKAIAPLEAVGVPRQEAVCCIGRICNEVGTNMYFGYACSVMLYSLY